MTIKSSILVIATLIGGGIASGCGDASSMPAPSPRAKTATLSPASKAKADAVRNVIIQQSSQNTFRPSTPDYGSGFKY